MWCCDRAVLASSRPAGLRPGQHPPPLSLSSVSPTHLLFPTPSRSTRCEAPKLFCHLLNLSVVTQISFLFLFFLNNILCRYHGATTQQFAGGVAKTKGRRQSHITPWIAVRRVLEFKFNQQTSLAAKKKIAGIGEPASASAV